MNWTVAGILVVINVPVYVVLARWILGGWEGFVEAVRFWATPDWLSMFRGEWEADWEAEMKLGLWAIACVAAVAVQYKLLTLVVPGWFA
jgi:hypothetical protein